MITGKKRALATLCLMGILSIHFQWITSLELPEKLIPQVEASGTECSDGLDNDGDGKRDAFTERTAGGGNFSSENAQPKYNKTWIASITCRRSNGSTATIGGGNPFTVASQVRSAIDSKNLPYTRPTSAIIRSTGGTGGGFHWHDNGTPHTQTLNAVCNILGYESYVSSTCLDTERSHRYPHGKCNFHSPHNNNLFRFNGNIDLPECVDGRDNDGDGSVDMSDSGCASTRDDSEYEHDDDCDDPNDDTERPTQCSDGLDNDGDGARDDDDFSCSNDDDDDETNPKSECQDGIDNDGNGFTDFGGSNPDPGCSSAQDDDEDGYDPQCNDGLDNDGDGATDHSGGDYSCSSATDNDETNPKSECQDGIDNDGNGFTDFEGPNPDPGCNSNQDNDEDGYVQNPELRIVKEHHSPSVVRPGENRFKYTIDVFNDGNGPAENVVVTDTFPSYLVYDPSESSDDCRRQGTSVICTTASGAPRTITAGASKRFAVVFSVPNDVNLCGQNVVNQARVNADNHAQLLSTQITTPIECFQCHDGEDNDNDGEEDSNDFSCSGPTDNDETNPKSQCQDGIDNDGNGVKDFEGPNPDPGCNSNQDNTESGYTPQCNDGLDNDGDGATDHSGGDFSCSSATDNDETNPKSQCQDGIDNDGNGVKDFEGPNPDPGCNSNQDNTESGYTPQCNDGLDNDGDGATDHSGGDFSCSSATDNDETNPKSECQDGIDNDGNGVKDFEGPNPDLGCSSNQDNTESGYTPQCNDGLDNDGDGATDHSGGDFSCSSNQDNDETNPKSECQDGIDNDGNGLRDFEGPNPDPGCDDNQDNDEDGFTPASADLYITKTGPSTVIPGNTVSYTLTARNDGPSTATNVTAQDPIPAGLTFNQGASSSACVQNGNNVLCDNLTLTDGQSHDFTVVFNVPASYACNATISNTASVSTSITDPNPNNNQSQTVSTTAYCPPPEADLRVTKTGPSTVMRGMTVSYTLTAINDGPDTATNVTVQDSIPAGLTFNQGASSSACVQNGSNVLCDNLTLTDGQSHPFTVSFNVSPSYTCNGSISNQASVATSITDPNPNNNQSQTISTTVTCPPDPICADDDDNDNDGATDYPEDYGCRSPTDSDEENPKPACDDGLDNDGDGEYDHPDDPGCSSKQDNNEGGEGQCLADLSRVSVDFIRVQNQGNGNATNGIILGNGTSISENQLFIIAANGSSVTDPTLIANSPRLSVRRGNGYIEIFGYGEQTVNDIEIVEGTITFQGATAAQVIGKESTYNNPIEPIANGDRGELVGNGSQVYFKFLYSNGSDGIRIYYDIDQRLCQCEDNIDNDNDGEDDDDDFSCSGPTDDDETNPKSQCQDGLDNDGDNLKDFTGPIPDPGCDSNQDNDEFNVISSDLSVTKTGPNTVVRGSTVSYTLTALNNGPDTASNVTVQDPIPAGLTFNQGASSSACVQNGSNVLCDNLTLINGQSHPFTVAFDVPVTHTCNSTILNSASVSTSATDPNPNNNQSQTVSTTVQCPVDEADLTIIKDGPSVIGRNQTISYTLIAHNNGPQTAQSVVVTDPIPTGLTFKPTASSTECAQVGASIRCTGFNLTNGQNKNLTVSFTVPVTAACNSTILNTASLSSSTTDPNTGNNQSSNVYTQVDCSIGDWVTLNNVNINGCNVTVNYEKNFATCAHMKRTNPPGGSVHTQNMFCANQGPVTVDISRFAQDFQPGLSVYLCHGNNCGNVKSNSVPVTGGGVCQPGSDLSISKTGPSIIARGSTISYTLAALNQGPDTATNVVVEDPIPSGLTFNQSASSAGCVQNGSNILCNNLTLTNGQSHNFVVAFNVPPLYTCGASIQNAASVSTSGTDPNPANNQSQTVTSTVDCSNEQTDLSISLSGPATVPSPGGNLTYTATVTNEGPFALNAPAEFRDPVPTGLVFEPSQSSNSCSLIGTDVVCLTSLLGVGASENFTIVFSLEGGGATSWLREMFGIPKAWAAPPPCGTNVINQVMITNVPQGDPNSSNNTSNAVSTTVQCSSQADLSLVKTGPSTVARGNTVSYTLVATNAGPSTATNVVVEDPIPSGLTFNSAASSVGCVQNGVNILCNNLTLTSGQSHSFTVAFNVPAVHTCGASIQNAASVSSSSTDPNPNNNQSLIVSTTVQCPVDQADVSVAKTGPNTVTRGNTITYTLVATNSGPDTATNVVVEDPIPAGLTFNSAASSAGCVQNGSNILCNNLTLTGNQSQPFTVAFNVPSTYTCNGVIQNRASVSTSATDPNPNNNQSLIVSTTVQCPVDQADVSVSKTGPSTVVRGSTVSYTLTALNNGPDTATNVVVEDPIPSGLTFNQSASSAGCVQNGSNILCNNLTLTNGQSQNFTVAFNVPSTYTCNGVIQNRASVSTSATDPNPNNNQSQAVHTTVQCTTTGCIDVVKEAYGIPGNLMTPVPQDFTFVLDGGQSLMTDSSGHGRFTNVPVGSHDVFEIIPYGWMLFSKNPSNSIVQVQPGPTCSTITFKDRKQDTNNPFLTIEKTDNRTTAAPGETLVYTITVSNSSNVNAIDVSVGDLLPMETTYVSSSDNGVYGHPLIVWYGLTIPAGGSKQLTLTVEIMSNVQNGEEIVNMAQIHHGQTAIDSTTVVIAPVHGCIDIVKEAFTPSNQPIVPVPQFTFELDGGTATAVSNSLGQARIQNVPAGTHTVSEIVPQGWDLFNTTPPNGVVSVSPGPICSTVLFKNRQQITGSDLSVVKTGPSTVARGNTITYTLTATNDGPDTATNVVVEDPIPSGLTFNSTASSVGCVQNGSNILCDNLTLLNGQSHSFTVAFNVPPTYTCNGTILNQASVSTSATDPDPSNNQSQTISTTVQCPVNQADLQLTKSGPSTAVRGGTAVYTLSLTNLGPDTATNITVDDAIPAGMTFNASLSDNRCVFNPQTANLVECSLASLTAGSTESFTITVDISPTATCNIPLVNSASATSSAQDPNDANNTNRSVTTTIQCPVNEADVSVTKNGPGVITRGNTISYTLVALNNGPQTASNVVVEDPIPAGLTFNQGASSVGCVQNGVNILCDNLSLASGQSRSYTVSFNVPPTYACNGTIQNAASVSTSTTDPNPANNQSQTISTTVQCPVDEADLSITKTGPATVNRGTTISYILEVTNNGPDTATNVVAEDPVPNGLTFNPIASSAGCVLNGSNVLCDNLTLTNGQSQSYTVAFDIPASFTCNGTIQNAASVSTSATDPNPVNNQSQTISTTVDCSNEYSDVRIEKNGPSTVLRGGTIQYSVTVTNDGPATAQGVTINDPIPAGLTFNPTASDPSCIVNGTNILCNNIALANGQSRTVTVAFDVPPTAICSSDITNVATVSTTTTDPNSANNTSQTVSTTVDCPPVEADLDIVKTGRIQIPRNETLIYMVQVLNRGPDAAQDVIVTDPIPTGLIFNASQSDGTCQQVGNNIVCTGPALPANLQWSLNIAFDIDQIVQCGAVVQNYATVASTTTDPVSSNNTSAIVDTTVNCPAGDMSIAKSGPSTVLRGNKVTYNVTVTNNSNTISIINSRVFDQTPLHTTFVPAESTPGCFIPVGFPDVSCPPENIPPSGTRNLIFTFEVQNTAPCNSYISNIADVWADNASTTWSNEVLTQVTCPVTSTDIGISKTGSSSVLRGDILEYTIAVTNYGPGNATNVEIADPIPAGLTFNAANSSAGCQLVGVEVECSGINLVNGASQNLTLAFDTSNTIACGASVHNRARVQSTPQGDPNPINNLSQIVSTTVNCPVTQADLSIIKTGPASVMRGNTVTYSVTATNNGPDTSTNVVITDPIPSIPHEILAVMLPLTFDSGNSDPSCISNGTDILCDNFSLNAGDSKTVQIAFTVPAQGLCSSTIINQAAVSASSTDPNPTNNLSTNVQTTVNCPVTDADLEISKTGQPTVQPGTRLSYNLTVHNLGPSTATNVTAADPIPTVLNQFGQPIPLTFDPIASDPSCLVNGANILCNNFSLTNNQTKAMTVAFTVPADAFCNATIVNQATVSSSSTDPNSSNNTSNTVTSTVNCPVQNADLEISKMGRDRIPRGETLLYTLQVFNHGPDTAADVIYTDAIPAGLIFNASQSDNICQQVGSDVVCTGPTLTSGLLQSITIAFDIGSSVACGSIITNTAAVSSITQDPNVNNNTSHIQTIVECPTDQVFIEKTGSSSVVRGDKITYGITVTNSGAFTVQNASIFDPVPPNTTYVPAESSPDCSFVPTANPPVIFCSPTNLAPGQQRTVTLVFQVESTAQCNGVISNIADVWSDNANPNWSNEILTQIHCPVATFNIEKTDNRSTVSPGETLSYQVSVTNTSNVNATNVQVIDTLPANVTFVAASDSGTFNGSNVTWNNLSINAGETKVLMLTVSVNIGTQAGVLLTNTASVVNGPSATDQTTVTGQVTFDISKTDGRTNADAGETLIYAIPITNTSSTNATNVTVTDTLPPNVTFVSANNGGTHSNGVVTWTGLSIAAAQTANLQITVTINATTPGGTILTNTAQILGGPNATDTTTVNGGSQFGCIDIVKEVYDVAGNPMTPVPQEFTFLLDGGQSLMIDSNGHGRFTNVTAGTHNISEIIPFGWLLFSKSPSDGNVQVQPGPTCSTVTFKNRKQPDPPFLTIEKTDNRTTASPGETLVYTVTVSNSSNVDAIDVSVGDLLPMQTTYVSSSDGGIYNDPLIIWYDLTIPAGGSKQLTLTVQVKSSAQPGEEVVNMAQIHHGLTAMDSTTIVGSQDIGCIDIVKETFDINSQLITPVAQFTFKLDGGVQTAVNDSLGNARFQNVPTGTHTVSEIVPPSWELLSVTPPNGLINVSQGPTCSTVLFKNRQQITDIGFIMSKTDNRTTATAGETLTYTINVENTSPLNATGVTVLDTLPANATFVSADNGGTHINGVVTWSGLSVNANSTTILTVTATVNAGTPDNTVLTNTASIPNKATAVDTTTVSSQQPTFTITKTDNLANATPGQALSYIVTIQNTSAFNATNVTVTDTLPSQVTYNSSSDSGTVNGQVVTWSGLSIAAGATKQLTVTATVNTGTANNTVLTNTANILNGPTATDTTTVTSTQPTLTISKTDNRTTVKTSETLTYIITVQNTSSTTATNVSVSDQLPGNTTYVSSTNGGTANGQTVTWSNLTVNANSTTTLTVTATVNTGTPDNTVLTNVAQIAGGLSSTDTTTVEGGTIDPNNVTIDLTDDRDPVDPGESFCYTIRITNLNSSQLTNQTVTQTLDGDTEYQSASQGGSHSSNIVTWNSVTLPANGTKTMNTCVRVDDDTDKDLVSSQAFISSKSDTETTRVGEFFNGRTRCEIQSISDSPDPVEPGEEITYSIRVRNGRSSTSSTSTSGRSTLFDVVAFLDNDLEFISAGDGGDDDNGREVEWKDLRLRRGESDSVRLTVRVKDTTRDDRVRIRVQCEDDEEFENTRIEGDIPPSDGKIRASINKRASRQEANPGDIVTYTITLRNLTDKTAKDVTVEDRFNAGSISIQDTGGGKVAGNGIDWELPTLGPNDTRIFTYRVRVGPDMRHGQIISNSVIARSSDLENSPTDIEEVRVITELPQTGMGGFGNSFADTAQNLRPTKVTLQTPDSTAAMQFILWTSIISFGILGGGFAGKRMFF